MACKSLDAQVVRPEDPELARLLDRFVPVRITDLKNVDMNRFVFDYDLTFAVLMMNPEGVTYSRFGTQDHRIGTDRMSIAGLKQAMKDVLEAHAAGRAPAPAALPPYRLADIPAYAKSKQAQQPCAHCHFANNFRFKQLRAEGKFRKEMVFQYPLPDNVGVVLDVDRNNVVKSVIPSSPADRAKVMPGDRIMSANGTPVFTAADFQFALNTLPDPGKVTLTLGREGRTMSAVALELPAGWRRTDISWRASLGELSPSVGFWGEPLSPEQKRARAIPEDRLALRVTFLFPGEKWVRTRGGLQNGDIVTGVDGKALPAMNTRQFHSYFRINHEVGDTATFAILRGDQRIELKAPCLDVNDD